MNFVIISRKLPVAQCPIQHRKLAQLLNQFGIAKVRHPCGRMVMFTKHSHRTLWDVWELVKERWKKLCRQLHPDVSGNSYEQFAVMSAIHDMILLRLKKKGISCS
jgi:hypothetical protein